MLQLSEETHQELEITAPLIVFFGMAEKEQIAVLPILQDRKYGFPAGDWTTSNALEVLIYAYMTWLNSTSIDQLERVQAIIDELDHKSIEDSDDRNLISLVDELLSATRKIAREYFEIIDNANIFRTTEWKSLRQLSSILQRKLEVQLVVDREVLENCIEYWLHP